MYRNLLLFAVLFPWSVWAQNPVTRDEREDYKQQIKDLQDRVRVVEDALRTLLQDRAASPVGSVAPAPVPGLPSTALPTPPPTPPVPIAATQRQEQVMPPELLPEIGKIGAEIGIQLNGASNPYRLDSGTDVAGFLDLPLFDKPAWLHGKISYEMSVGLSRSQTTFSTTSNVAQIANLTVLNTLYPNGGAQNLTDAVSGTGMAPFPVTSPSVTTMKLLQVVPISFKYTTTALDRFRLRPYGLLGFGAYVTIHEQSPLNSGVRLNANLPASVVSLVNSLYGGQAPFGGQLVAGQIAQSSELEARGLPSGHGNIDLGWLTGGGFEYRLSRSFSLGFDARWNRISGAPGALTTYGTRLGFHF